MAEPNPLGPAEAQVMSFFSPGGAAAAIKASKFDLEEEFERLIQWIRDPDPKVSLKAQGQFRKTLESVAVNSGLLAKIEVTSEDGRGKARMTASQARVFQALQEKTSDATEEDRKDAAARHIPPSRS